MCKFKYSANMIILGWSPDNAATKRLFASCLAFFSIAGRLHHYRRVCFWISHTKHSKFKFNDFSPISASSDSYPLIKINKSDSKCAWNEKKSYLIKNLASFKRCFSCSHQLTWRCRRTLPEKLQRWSGGKKVMKEEKLIYLRIAEILSSEFHSALYFA